MDITIDKWIYNEQKKHHMCGCGCGNEIVIKKHHYRLGVPMFIKGHYLKYDPMYNHKIDSFVQNEQGKHFCNCGCGNEIKIERFHYHRAIPKFIRGHQFIGTKHKKSTIIKMSKSARGTKNHSYMKRGKESYKYNSDIDAWIIENKNKHICQCGCGRIIPILRCHYNRGIPKFIENHVPKGEFARTWEGGKSFEPYCHKFNTQSKERIRERDNRICQGCGVKENGSKLSIHHIHYDKENCYPDLIAVCRSCNSKANANKNWHEIYYMRKLLFNKTETSVYNLESELEVWNYGSFI